MMTKFLSNNILTTLALAAVLIVIAVLLLNLAYHSTMDRFTWREESYTVQRGDTLWIISRTYCPKEVDRREWVEEIRALNGLTECTIYPGQVLTVLTPTEEA